MNKCYDPVHKRLIFLGNNAAIPQFWDSTWAINDFPTCVINQKKDRFLIGNTSKYLPTGSKILEGGCGKGDKVYLLNYAGYDAYGVDFAPDTVALINQTVPELNVTYGDIRELDFPDGYFDGYWSIGVIEHFFEGYENILAEMHRVLRKEGYLFLTVPTLSVLRKCKAALHLYPVCEDFDSIQTQFYQFALLPEQVIMQFTAMGFELKKLAYRDGVKGLRDEITFLFRPLNWCWQAKSFYARVIKKILQVPASPFCGHMAFFIFKKV